VLSGKLPIIPYDHLEIGRRLGSGASGEVFAGILNTPDFFMIDVSCFFSENEAKKENPRSCCQDASLL
jgi:hypothetical protein